MESFRESKNRHKTKLNWTLNFRKACATCLMESMQDLITSTEAISFFLYPLQRKIKNHVTFFERKSTIPSERTLNLELLRKRRLRSEFKIRNGSLYFLVTLLPSLVSYTTLHALFFLFLSSQFLNFNNFVIKCFKILYFNNFGLVFFELFFV